jgi:DNA primase
MDNLSSGLREGQAPDSAAGILASEHQWKEGSRAHGRERRGLRAVKEQLVNISAICLALGLDTGAKRQSNGLWIRCPLPQHDDRDPSCSVTHGKDGLVRVRCFSCAFKGDVFTLIAVAKGLNIETQFRSVMVEAIQLVQQGGEAMVDGAAAAFTDEMVCDAAACAAVSAALLDRCPLDGTPDIVSYLAGRGLLEPARVCGVGGLPLCPAAKKRILDAVIDHVGTKTWQSSGFAGKNGQLKYLDHRILLPYRNFRGRVVVLQRRHLGDGDAKYVFPTGAKVPGPFGIETMASADKNAVIVFVEGALDALAARKILGTNEHGAVVLGLPGVGHIRPEWAALARGREVRVALDADDAGDAAAQRLADELHQAGARRVHRLRPPAGQDWSDVVAERARS